MFSKISSTTFSILSISPVPITASTSGSSFKISSEYFCAKHPATINFFKFPVSLNSLTSKIVSIDSSLASPINPQVFTITISASDSSLVSSIPFLFDKIPK